MPRLTTSFYSLNPTLDILDVLHRLHIRSLYFPHASHCYQLRQVTAGCYLTLPSLEIVIFFGVILVILSTFW